MFTYKIRRNDSNEWLDIKCVNSNNTNPFATYGQNRPVVGGYFAGYYNNRPNIVGRKLFIEA